MDTWLILIGICVLLLCLVLTVSVLIVYSGVFETIEVKTGKPPIGKVTIAYKFARGPYSEVGPLFFEVAKIAPDNRAIGIYYDDPARVESRRLRYIVACILAEGEQAVDEEMVKKFEADGFKTMDLPLVEYAVHTTFPYKCSLSIFVGAKRVYSKMAEYIEEHGLQPHPFLEIYTGSTIYYMAPLDEQDKFYAPESLQQFPGEEPYESVYSTQSKNDASEEDSAETDQERPETESLLHPSQIMKAEVIGKVEEELKQSPGEKKEALEEKAEDSEGKEDSPEPGSATVMEETKKERGSDEESGSSFEDLKLEVEEVTGKPLSE